MDPMGYEPPAKKNITTNPKAVLRQGSVHNQPKQGIIIGELPQKLPYICIAWSSQSR